MSANQLKTAVLIVETLFLAMVLLFLAVDRNLRCDLRPTIESIKE